MSGRSTACFIPLQAVTASVLEKKSYVSLYSQDLEQLIVHIKYNKYLLGEMIKQNQTHIYCVLLNFTTGTQQWAIKLGNK